MSENFYLKVRETRKKRGLTIKQVSEATGVSKSHISEYETNKTNLESKKLMSICRFLKIDFGINEDRPEPKPVVSYPTAEFLQSDLAEIIENLKTVWPELCSEQKDAVRSVVNAFSKQPQFSLETNARQG